MSRSLPEWIGKTPDTPIPPRVRVRVFERAEGHCQWCGRRLHPGHWDCDHIRALVNGGEHRESNLQAVCKACHKMKSLVDLEEKSTVYRKRAKAIGIKKKRTSPMPGARDSKWKKTFSRGWVLRDNLRTAR